MKTYLNVRPAKNDESLLRRFEEMGMTGVRTESNRPHDKEWLDSIDALSKSRWDSRNIYLLFGGHMTKLDASVDSDDGEPWLPDEMPELAARRANDLRKIGLGVDGEAVEIGNEPDLAHKRWRSKRRAKELAQVTNRCADEIWTLLPDVSVLCPSVSNLNGRGFSYLDEMLEYLDSRIGVAFHRYPAGDSPHNAQRGFPTRNEELAKLQSMTAGRDLWCTEAGFSSYGDRTEEEQADYIDLDMRFNHDRRLEHYTLYGLNDGPNQDERLDRYGLRHFNEAWDGEWKEIGQRFPNMIARYA